MTKKRGRIRQTKTEWQKAFEEYGNFQSQSWHFCLPELLHISIALLNHDFEKVKYDFLIFCQTLSNTTGSSNFYGNLSSTIGLIKSNRDKYEELKDNCIYNSVNQVVIFYEKILQIDSFDNTVYEKGNIIKSFQNLLERKSDFTILCKFIFVNNIYKNDTRPLRRIISTKAEVLEDLNRSVINSAWLMLTTSLSVIDYYFTNSIWTYNYVFVPMNYLDETIKEEQRFKDFRINELKEEFLENANEFREIKLFAFFDRTIAEIIMGFINRSIYLSKQTVELVENHNGEIAEAVLRMLYENRLKLLWLLNKKDLKLFQRFREYSAGREKLFYDKMTKISNSELLEDYKKEVDFKLKQEGLNDFEVAIERGDVYEIGVDKMADQLGEDERYLYDFVYKRTSDIVHGNWRIIEKYHLIRSDNPMHDRLLDYNLNENKFAGLLPAFLALMLASETILKLLEEFEDYFKDFKELQLKVKNYHKKIKEEFINNYFPSIRENE